METMREIKCQTRNIRKVHMDTKGQKKRKSAKMRRLAPLRRVLALMFHGVLAAYSTLPEASVGLDADIEALPGLPRLPNCPASVACWHQAHNRALRASTFFLTAPHIAVSSKRNRRLMESNSNRQHIYAVLQTLGNVRTSACPPP